MKKASTLLNCFLFILTLSLISCGSDNSSTKKSSEQSALNGTGTQSVAGNQCNCTASYMPVCGANNITYDNICIAKCYGVTLTSPGNCICTNRPVCGDDGQTYEECDAQDALRRGNIKSIVKFAACDAASY